MCPSWKTHGIVAPHAFVASLAQTRLATSLHPTTMRPAKITLALALAATPFLTASAFQTRVSQGAEDFKAVIQNAVRAWDAGNYGAASEELRKATAIVAEKRSDSLRASLPDAPEGWEIKPERKVNAQNPFAAAMGGVVGSVIQRSYNQTGGNGRIEVTLTADSPMVGMLGMAFTNPAMLDANSELIEYEAHKAILKKAGGRLELQVLISGKHVLDTKLNLGDEDFLFSVFDQAAIDRVAAALGA